MALELPLLQPVNFRAAIEQFIPPQELILLNRFRRQGMSDYTAAWDIYTSTRMVAKPNVPNSEAHIVSLGERSAARASWIYLRTKMGFRPSTTRMLRAIGNRVDQRRTEAEVLRDVQQLDITFDNFAEMCWWSAMSGKLSAEYRGNVWDVDYMYPESHQPVPAVSWANASPAKIMHDINTWKELIRRDSQVEPDEVYTTKNTMRLIWNAFARITNEDGSDSNVASSLLSERMKDQYYATGEFGEFLGLNWRMVDSTYQQDSGTFADFVPDGALYMGNYNRNNFAETWEGPSFDFAAPDGYIGKFAKNWENDDPSGRWFLLEWSFLPIIFRPLQCLFVSSVAPDLYSGLGRTP
jgi:hypothetical protein